MKQITTILFLLLALACAGQDIDTTYTALRWGYNPVSQDSVYFETKTTVYSDGRIFSAETIAGDTATVINYPFNRAAEQGREFAVHANEVWLKESVVDFILQANGVLSALFDTSIIEISVDLYGPLVDNTTWDIISTQGNFTGQMTINPNGNNFRMQVGATTYTLLPAGDAWIRFQNFPQGSYTDLHRKRFVPGGKLEFRSVDESLIIRQQ